MDKEILRTKYRTIRKKELLKEEKSLIIGACIFNLDEYLDAGVIAIYLNTLDEVDTKTIILKMLDDGKVVLVPKVITDYDMVFSRIYDLDHLEKGRYGILEPKDIEIYPKEKIDLFIVPGVSFDKEGNRLGNGKGYYDRYLKNSKGCKIGVCFHKQLSNKIITIDPNDVKMDYLITNEIVLKF